MNGPLFLQIEQINREINELWLSLNSTMPPIERNTINLKINEKERVLKKMRKVMDKG